MTNPIENYAVIGDTQTAALVGTDGSIDWLCLPRFDSPSCFSALLGDASHGRWLIAPAVPVRRVSRRYRPGTLVLETTFETGQGTVRVVDCMPPRQRVPDVVRVIEGVEGSVPMRMELVVRFDYGSAVPWVRRTGDGLSLVAGPDALILQTPVSVEGREMASVAAFHVSPGERVPFVLTWHPSHEPTPHHTDPLPSVGDTERWWHEWASCCTYQGPWRDRVLRSLITLKALTFAPSGGVVAAATASLPEELGGVRNWDYRFCWLRDATFTLYSLMSAGFVAEAAAWRDWLLRAVAGDPRQMQIMYGPAGERRLPELELDWLPGYEGSRPVRIGNAAAGQCQLDVYGEVMDCLHQARKAGLPPDPVSWGVQTVLLEFLETAWREPDEGLWEVRGPRRHFTHSKVMAWVAFDRAVKAVERHDLSGPVERWRSVRGEIHSEVCRRGWDRDQQSFTQSYGSAKLDASLLMIPLVGFLPASDHRVQATVDAIQRDLCQDGFVLRYLTDDGEGVDGLPGREGAFLACSFWLVDNLAMMGRTGEAEELFERLVGLCNDVGLLSEQYDPLAGRLVGNFPQAFSHVGLVNSALNLSEKRGPAEDRRRE